MKPIKCNLCNENEAVPGFLRTCVQCMKYYNKRINTANAEKRKTQGDILKDGLFGPNDKRIGRGPQRKDQKARPILKVDDLKDTSKVIEGRPRTGRMKYKRR